MQLQNTSDDYGPICPASTDDSAQYIVGKDEYATLWSSSKAAHGYHYAFFTAKTNGVVRWRNTARHLNEIELCHMQVLPEYRGKGFGRGIVNFLHMIAVESAPRAEAPKRMILECKRELARRFYERCDFKPTTEPMGNAGTAPGHVWLVRDRMGYLDM